MIFRSRATAASITLYPMVHVGEESFYRDTYAEAFSHDVTLVEGVRSPVVRRLTRSYRWLNLARLGLVLQSRAPTQDMVTARIVKADLSPEEFHRAWRKVPLALRATYFVMMPLVGLHRRLFASRESIAEKLSLEDRRSAEEIMMWSPGLEALNQSVLHSRDARLIECLGAELDAAAGSGKRIAIVYGAMHMRAVLRELTRRGFHCSEAYWRTSFAS